MLFGAAVGSQQRTGPQQASPNHVLKRPYVDDEWQTTRDLQARVVELEAYVLSSIADNIATRVASTLADMKPAAVPSGWQTPLHACGIYNTPNKLTNQNICGIAESAGMPCLIPRNQPPKRQRAAGLSGISGIFTSPYP